MAGRQRPGPGAGHPTVHGATVPSSSCATWWPWPSPAAPASSPPCGGPGTTATPWRPVDLRLPPRGAAATLDALAPGVVVDEDGPHRRAGGRSVEAGDAVVSPPAAPPGSRRAWCSPTTPCGRRRRPPAPALGADAARDQWLACLPLAHIGGLSVVMRAVVTGTPLTVHDGFDAAAVTAAARTAPR